jgi:hypothetical protein
MDSDPPPRSQAQSTESGDGPYGSGSLFHTTAPFLGGVLGICTLVLPMAMVITDRGSNNRLITSTPIARPLTNASTADGFAQSAGLTSARAGESDGGDPRREPQ